VIDRLIKSETKKGRGNKGRRDNNAEKNAEIGKAKQFLLRIA